MTNVPRIVYALPMDTLSRLRRGDLAGAKRLDLACDLEEFPAEILTLADSLEILNLSGNRLSSLPDEFSKLGKLKILFCSENQFRELPPVLGKCAGLEMIGFKSNRIDTVTGDAFPPLLRWLILTDNRIDSLPDEIAGCEGLRKLMLSGNRLSGLPAGMAACVNLELIRLAANRFQGFPEWLFELPRLAWLGLGGNPCTTNIPDGEIVPIRWGEIVTGEKLGEGASGMIFDATWNSRDHGKLAVAVKVFKGEMTSDGLPDSEMAIAACVGEHPNLIRVLGRICDHPEDRNALVMPLIGADYTSLAGPPDFSTCTRDVFPAGHAIEPHRLVRYALDLCSLGAHLHGRRILHGDFYAHNILRDERGHLLLGDFGAACWYGDGMNAEKIEVLAFGILLGELLSLVSCDAGEPEWIADISNIRRRCAMPHPGSRPDFATILEELESLAGRAGI